jgi:hypothetical protein
MTGEASEARSLSFRRGNGDGMSGRRKLQQHGKPRVGVKKVDQPDAGDGQAG